MANGGKREVFNTRERVISNDFNRLQDMIGQARAAQLARLYNDNYVASRPGQTSPDITGGDLPMNADVFGGLFVKVDDPTSLFIDAGVVGIVDPDSPVGLDDDPYKVIDDPGLQTGGVLTFLANASGNKRIDVVVASPSEVVLETDSRDVFDPATGLFTPQTVNKVVAKRLTYSIIRGTPGAGMPALTNTIVLAVASVPDGASDWSDVTFWDVRPLVQQRTNWGVESDTTAKYEYNWVFNGSEFKGEAWSEYGGYVAGGVLKKSTPTSTMGTGDVDLDPNDPENSTSNDEYRGAGEVPPGNDEGASPIFALFPSGLPGWARYSEGSAPGLTIRAPYGARGILVAGRRDQSDFAKIDSRGFASAVNLPAATGLTGTSSGVCLMVIGARTLIGNAFPDDAYGMGRRVVFKTRRRIVTNNNAHFVVSKASVAGNVSVAFDFATDFRDNNLMPVPPNANGLKLSVLTPEFQTNAGFPPPNVTRYNRLKVRIELDGVEDEHTVGSNLGDGSTVPEVGFFTTRWLPVSRDADSPPANLPAELSINVHQIDLEGSSYQYTNDTANFYLVGYEV